MGPCYSLHTFLLKAGLDVIVRVCAVEAKFQVCIAQSASFRVLLRRAKVSSFFRFIFAAVGCRAFGRSIFFRKDSLQESP